MSVDIRARFLCPLGKVITGSISDNQMLEKGLVSTTGELVIEGNVQRPRGTQIDIAYMEIDSNTGERRITRFPRRLRALSCTADPFRNTTTFQLGDKIAMAQAYYSDTDVYFAGYHEPSWWGSNEFYELGWWFVKDPQQGRWCKQTVKKQYQSKYSDYVWEWEYDRIRKTVPTIEAWPLAKYILSTCNIQLNFEKSYKLRFQFLEPAFKFNNGYIELLDDLIVSEACYGYLDMNEQLVIKKYPVEMGNTAPALREANVIDIQAISSSDNPDTAMSVSFEAKQRVRIAGRTLDAYTTKARSD